MMRRTPVIILFLLLSYVGNYGQGSGGEPEWYDSLIPGQSTKPEVEKLLGQPLKTFSETLFEYEPKRSDPAAKIVLRAGPNTDPTYRLYIQYRKRANVVDRIEKVYDQPQSRDSVMRGNLVKLSRYSMFAGQDTAKVKATTTVINSKGRLEEYFSSDFVVMTHESATLTSNVIRLAYYSKELFATAVPSRP